MTSELSVFTESVFFLLSTLVVYHYEWHSSQQLLYFYAMRTLTKQNMTMACQCNLAQGQQAHKVTIDKKLSDEQIKK